MSDIASRLRIADSEQRRPRRRPPRAARARSVAPGSIDWWQEHGAGRISGLASLSAHRGHRSTARAGPSSASSRCREYRWGILLAPAEPDRKIAFGQHKGEPVWQEVPGEYRAMLRRLIVIQGDTEPASVEQQRHLGKTAPSLYDLRNLFQVNVEEGRHLWAMVYLLQSYFGRDGREEAEELLQRRSGDADTPRILGAFNERTPDWLSFFMFTSFTDRDGKMQLEALAQSGFDPLSRTCRFMLTEEAHHMFVGKTGVERIIQRTCEAMKAAGIDDPHDIGRSATLGVIDLPTMQKKLNLHYSVTLDLFGSEISTNAANAFNAGIKGRFHEDQIDDDHQLREPTYRVLKRSTARSSAWTSRRSARSTCGCATITSPTASRSRAGTRSSMRPASLSSCGCRTSRSIARSATSGIRPRRPAS